MNRPGPRRPWAPDASAGPAEGRRVPPAGAALGLLGAVAVEVMEDGRVYVEVMARDETIGRRVLELASDGMRSLVEKMGHAD